MADPEPKQQGNTLRLRRPSGIIFDLGGTVMEEKSFNSLAGNTRLLEFAIDSKGITAQDIQRLANDIDCDVERIRDNCTAEFTWQNFQRLLFETLGISFSIGYERMEKEFRRASIVHIPEDGIFELLNLLDTHGIKRGIVSNTSFSGASLEEDLAAHKLANQFPFILSSSDYGFRKPSRRIFEVAIKKIGLERKDIWFVGNKLDTDIKGAIRSGLFPVWYNPENKANTGYECLEVRSWREFGERVEELYKEREG